MTGTLFVGYLKSQGDLDTFIRQFSMLVDATDKPFSGNTCRQLWFTLMSGEVSRNIYGVRMPYLVRTAFLPYNPQSSFLFLGLPKKCASEIGIPATVEIDKTGVYLSGGLRLQIKESRHDTVAKKRDVWSPPKDFDALASESSNLPASCYVELFLTDLQYVSEFHEPEAPAQSLVSIVLDQSPLLRHAWAEFRETFGLQPGK